MFHALVGRIDFVMSDEGPTFTAMVGQRF
jgi:hypothetical protein